MHLLAFRCLPRLPLFPVLLMVVLVPLAYRSDAQATANAEGATVVGHVTLSDGGRSARFATVYLKAVTPSDDADDFFHVLMNSAIDNMRQKQANGSPASEEDLNEVKSARAASRGFLTNVADTMLSVTIGPDGNYTFAHVPPGTYYLHVKAPGYIDTLGEFSADELSSKDPAVRKRVAAAVDTITVSGTELVRKNLELERGGSVNGRVLYEDGSPASGWTVQALAKSRLGAEAPENILGIDLSQLPSGQKLDRATTDDTGHFRIAGLPVGAYVLQASLNTAALDRQPFAPVSSTSGSFLSILGGLSGMTGLHLVVYSGSTRRLHEAKAFAVKSGEDRLSDEIIVPLAESHTVSGFVVSKTDGHAVNGGSVELIAQDSAGAEDTSLRFRTSVASDGSFRFDCVPGGTYTLRAVHVSDSASSGGMKLLGSVIAEYKVTRAYARSETAITLEDADVTAVRLMVEDARSAQAAHVSGH